MRPLFLHWESRYKSIAVLDTESLLATCAYIDLNQVAAGCATVPEESSHTSIKTRVEHCRRKGRLQDRCKAKAGSVSGLRACGNLEDDLWLCPIEDRPANRTQRAGLLERFSLGSYLQLVDWTSRLVRNGKARVNQDIGALLDRLGTAPEIWCRALQKMFSREQTMGVAFAFSRAHCLLVAEPG